VIEASIPPVFEFRAHNAPLGIVSCAARIIRTRTGAAIVALHGSWNERKTAKSRVAALAADGVIESRDFLTGFLGRRAT